ncbi:MULTISPECIES: recombinase family protein [unclassified Lactobacillus]|uniref:recombinase family protein n=1 Tax=unclassified Lactobacillus TaxID=2620435 RepID=UPI000EFC9080|nr:MULTISPECIES: recombinase family protein [unclassified Lactobacillus]RMC38096.1 recombinase family protein [Lactobacillus sp. ESL0237]RMC42651.1 recombinase family protein [Lactobacillus sp. ESL0234]RMC43324.1 recombinase family protein [Lactobacillus sp. ESL0236]RMC47864.1 recombinase family protein [Lactobacillus sp. ESL0225]
MNYGYARVSTVGQNLDTQLDLLKKANCDKIYQEKFTGATLNRPVFSKLLHQLKSGDQLTVTKLDRFARNTIDGLHIINQLFKKNVSVNILSMGGIIDNTPTGRLSLTNFLSFAQFERDMIVTRTQEGKEYAKLHDPNYREGRPRTYNRAQIEAAYRLKESGMTYKMISKSTGISERTLIRRFRELKDEKH